MYYMYKICIMRTQRHALNIHPVRVVRGPTVRDNGGPVRDDRFPPYAIIGAPPYAIIGSCQIVREVSIFWPLMAYTGCL